MIDMRLLREWMMWIGKRLGSFRNFLKFSMVQPCGFWELIMSLVISFFLELMSIHDTIELKHEKDSYLLRKMVDYMKNKFEKY